MSDQVLQHGFQNGTGTLTREDVLGSGLLRDEGAPLDRVILDFGAGTGARRGAAVWQGVELHDAQVELRLRRADDGAALRAFDRALGPPGPQNPGNETWTFGSGNRTAFALLVDLTSHGHKTPTPVVAEWRYTSDLDGNPRTPSGGVVAYTATFHYRVC